MLAIAESVDILHKCNIFSSGSYEQPELSVTHENCTISMKHGHRNLNILLENLLDLFCYRLTAFRQKKKIFELTEF